MGIFGEMQITPEDAARLAEQQQGGGGQQTGTSSPAGPFAFSANPWLQQALGIASAPPQGAFSSDPNAPGGGATRVISGGTSPILQTDVRTPQMQALEAASLPMLLTALTAPQNLASYFGNVAGPVPGAPQSGLANFLFNDAGAQAPPQGGGGGGQPAGGGSNPSNPARPNVDPSQPGWYIPGQAAPGNLPSGAPVPGNGPTPISSDPSTWGPLVGNSGSLLGGGAVQPGAPGVSNPADILAQFGLGNDALGITGLLPQSGQPGQELNLGALNAALNPQGYLLGAQHPTGSTPQGSSMMLGPNSFQQMFQPGDTSGIMSLLEQLGVNFRASGGPLDPNAPTIVGELGPELITPAAGAGQQQEVIPLMQTTQAPQNSFASSPQQGSGTGNIQRLLEQNPEMEAFQAGQNALFGQGGVLNTGGGGQGVVDALQPVFQQNLNYGLNALTNRVPSVRNSGAAIEGADLTSRAVNDFNLLAAQALQQGQQNTLGGLGMLGQLAGQAGQGAFGRNLAAGQLATQRDLGLGSLGLQAQQQAYNQAVNPTLQLLLAALGMATPTAFQTVAQNNG